MTVRARTTLAVGLAVLLVLALAPYASITAAGTPSGVHLTWQNDPLSTVTVTWFTDKDLSGYTPTVRYGTSTGAYTDSENGTQHDYSGATVDVSDVELTGLSPGSAYYYICGDTTHGFSEEKSFNTPPEYGGFKFCAFGDSREGVPLIEPDDNNDLEILERVVDSVEEEEPLFSLFTGDLVMNSWPYNLESSMNLWFARLQPLSGKSVLMSCHGNHEKNAPAYFDRFAFPGNEQWYSFDVSNVHFVCLDTGLEDNDEYDLLSGEQKTWLESDLQSARAGDCDWIVALFHRHAYASGGGHGDQIDVKEVLVPVLDQYGVDLAFSGHTHYYERFLPMKGGEVVSNSGSYYYKPGGTIYIIAGGAGAPLADLGSDPRVAYNEKVFHYCTVDVKADNTLVVSAKRYDDGSVLDQFTMSKKTPPVVTSVNPASALEGEIVTIKGQEFGSARDSSYVLFGATKASSYESWGDGSVKVKVPGIEPGEVDVKVVTPEGTSNGVPFTVLQEGAFQRFYFAEGTCRPNFEPYLCIQNPGNDNVDVSITYMPGAGENTVQPLTVLPRSRRTVRVKDVLGEGNDDAHDFSCLVEATGDSEVIVERPMYFDYQGMWDGGHDVIGTNDPGKDWYFAEGCTRQSVNANMHTWLCTMNPSGEEVEQVVRYMPADGENEIVEQVVPPGSRWTNCANWEAGPEKDLSIAVKASDGVICERPMYFNYNGTWDGGHCVMGAQRAAEEFYFAEGTCRPDFESYICIQNPQEVEAEVNITFMPGAGTNVEQSLTVQPLSRETLRVKDVLGEGNDDAHDFSCLVESTNGAAIIAERPMYFNYNGTWDGGHCVMGYNPQ